jgi:hypothetical protein
MKPHGNWAQVLKIKARKLGYKRAREKLPKDTQNTPISMQNQPAVHQQLYYHPHLDINTADSIQNPAIQAKLSSATLTITSPSTQITEFNYNSNIPDPYFAKVYLPNAMLTGYKNGVLKTAEGRAFVCVHFDPTDPRIFGLAGLNAPDPDSHVPNVNNVKVPTRPSTTPSMFTPSTTFPLSNTFHQPPASSTAVPADARSADGASPAPTPISTSTTQHARTTNNVSRPSELLEPPTAAVYHIAATRTITQPRHTYPTPSPPATPYLPLPTFLWDNGAHAYDQLLMFGSTWAHAENLITTDNTRGEQYTPVEISFLAQLQEYCRGKEELRRGITIPGELCAGQYLEMLDEEHRVSLQFPKIESLFSRAARTWPASIFQIFASITPTPYNKLGIYARQDKSQLPTPESSTDDDNMPSLEHDSDTSSLDPDVSSPDTLDLNWAYPPTPSPLPSFEIPQVTIQPLTAVPENPELSYQCLSFLCDNSRICKSIPTMPAS